MTMPSRAAPSLMLELDWTEVAAVGTMLVTSFGAVALTPIIVDFLSTRWSEQREAGRALAVPDNVLDKDSTDSSFKSNCCNGSKDEKMNTIEGNGGDESFSVSNINGGKSNGCKNNFGQGDLLLVAPVNVTIGARSNSKYSVFLQILVLFLFIIGSVASRGCGMLWLARVLALSAFGLLTLPYLCQPSKYRRDPSLNCQMSREDVRRPLSDMLVWTSFVYGVSSLYGFFVGQYTLGFVQAGVTIGSTLFHLNRETKFFNLDNIFATSLFLIMGWGLYLSLQNRIWWFVGVVGGFSPVAMSFILRCGMPGLICKHDCGHRMYRKSNPQYEFLHMLWHVSSGIGTIVIIHFFASHFPDLQAGGGWFVSLPGVPKVPTIALAISTLINLYGNYCGIMPLV